MSLTKTQAIIAAITLNALIITSYIQIKQAHITNTVIQSEFLNEPRY